KYTTKDYKKTVDEWPKEKPIWPYLTQKSAKENYLRYIVNFDLTNCRRYDKNTPIKNEGACRDFARSKETFENACKGYASQMAVRYSNFKDFSKEELENLKKKGRIYKDNSMKKYQLPLYMATIPGHAFNALPLGGNLKDIKNYIFLEPENDRFFDAGDTAFKSYFRTGILTISKLTGYNEQGQYEQTPVADFIKGGNGAPVNVELTPIRRMTYTNIARDIFIADDADAWNASVIKSKLTYEEFVKTRVDYYKDSDEDLAWVAGYLIGRQFRRSPKAKLETLTRSVYIKLLGRPSLEKLIPRERTK
ncbi:MAG: hypothetical protein GY757_60560, partial [bacterium]|nr:hypothetical protein [bacterium]